MIKAVIFDMNGVIINDEKLHEHAFRSVLKPFNINLDHQSYQKLFAGRTDKEGFKNAQNFYQINLPINKLINDKRNQYLNLFSKSIKPYPGVIELIHSLSQKYILALTSSANNKEVELITKSFEINHLFKVKVTSEDVIHGKPDPEPYLITSKKLNIKPKDCLVIEDSVAGIKSAKSAGMKCIAIANTRNKQSLAKADWVINNYQQIQNLLLKNVNNIFHPF